MLDDRLNQMNYELMYIEQKREYEKQALVLSHLKQQMEVLKQQTYSNTNLSKELKLKL